MADIYQNYLGSLNGIAITKYARRVEDVIPVDVAPLTSMLTLEQGQKLGLQYQFPLELTYDDSTTYAAAGAGAFGFNDTAPGQMLPAIVNSSNYLHRGVIDYETIARTDDAPSDGAIEQAVDRMMFRIDTGMSANMEIDFWYGGSNVGIVEAVLVGNGSNGVPTGQLRVTITNSSFAPGVWIGRKGSRFDVYDLEADGRPNTTKRNANAPLVLFRFDLRNRQVYFTGNSTDLAAVATGDGLLKFGTYTNSTQGMDFVILASLAGETVYNIPTSQYDLMQANTFDNGGVGLTLKRLYGAMSDSISKGVGMSGVDVWLNPDNFSDLLANESILRRYAEAGGQANNGFRGVSYDSQVGKMTFMPTPLIKRGETWIGPTKRTCSKVGAAEPALKNFGMRGGADAQYLKPIEGKAGCEAQKYGNLGFLNKRLAYWTKVTNIVPETTSTN